MSKIIQVVIYTSISDEKRVARYAELAGPAMIAQGAKFLARGIPVAVKEHGQSTRTVLIEWESMEAAERGYLSEGYQKALEALGDGAIREFRYVEAL